MPCPFGAPLVTLYHLRSKAFLMCGGGGHARLRGERQIHITLPSYIQKPFARNWYNAFIHGGVHVKAGWLNAADYDFVIIRKGITTDSFSVGDLHGDGNVNTPDAVIVIQKQNHLRQSRRP
jgi:hypothetical protein